MNARAGIVASLLVSAIAGAETATLSCKGAFAPDASEASLKKILGASNVRSEPIQLGEGETAPGSVVYPTDRSRRIEVLWGDVKGKRNPAMIRFQGKGWRTAEGITVGMPLRTIEKYNRRPFRIMGFGWDYGGTTTGWRLGEIDRRSDSRCALSLIFDVDYSFDTDEYRARVQSVSGDTEFSSGHPSMQRINPKVIQIRLSYK